MKSLSRSVAGLSLHVSQLWWGLAIVMLCQNLFLNALTQSKEDLLPSLLAWWGAGILMKSDIEDRRLILHPSRLGMWLGWIMLAWVLSRSYLISTRGGGASLLPLLAGIGLAFMGFPLREICSHWRSLAALALAPLTRLLIAVLPVPMFAVWTAGFTQALLLLFDTPVERKNDILHLPGGSVGVDGGCTGIPAMLQLIALSLILIMAFPMRHRWQNALMLLVAPVIGFTVNGVRIAILASINASQLANKDSWFQLIHVGWFSQLFPAIAMLIFLKLYHDWMESQVRHLHSGHED
jgi:cyanoexosortase A